MNTDDFSIIQNVVLSVTGIVGMVIAILGYKEWLKQLKGTDRYNAGKKVISALSDFRDGIEHVRNPFMWTGEFQYTEEESKNITDDIKAKGIERAYSARIKVLNDARKSLIMALKECEVLQRLGYIEECKPLLQIYAKVVTAVEMHVEEYHRGRYMRQESDDDRQWRIQQREIIYSRMSDKDVINNELKSEIAKLESKIREKFGV